MVRKVNVIIPSRRQPSQMGFLQRAVRSIREQSVASSLEIEILVAVDQGEHLGEAACRSLGVTCVESTGRSQASALNAGIARADADAVAFLEDDDQWMPKYLEAAVNMLKLSAFVSSTQLEHDPKGNVLRTNDFPTPSGWFMPLATLRQVGPFDESYRWHLDNDWLGRLRESGVKRIHLVEASAPVDLQHAVQVRPWLANVIRFSGGLCRLARHPGGLPLVRRMVHAGSGMQRIARDPALREQSVAENQRLEARYGALPW
jgi:glycosyltransferase involved in cell wall biosynthesis